MPASSRAAVSSSMTVSNNNNNNNNNQQQQQHPIINARSLAQEAVSWYLDQLDLLQTHAVNVETYLRGPVTALTVSILENNNKQVHQQNNNKNNNSSSRIVKEPTRSVGDVPATATSFPVTTPNGKKGPAMANSNAEKGEDSKQAAPQSRKKEKKKSPKNKNKGSGTNNGDATPAVAEDSKPPAKSNQNGTSSNNTNGNHHSPKKNDGTPKKSPNGKQMNGSKHHHHQNNSNQKKNSKTPTKVASNAASKKVVAKNNSNSGPPTLPPSPTNKTVVGTPSQPPAAVSWRDYLNVGPDVSLAQLFCPEKTKELSSSSMLDERSKARLDAFLEGVALAVVAEPPPQQQHQLQRARTNSMGSNDSFSLIDGLVGFRSATTSNAIDTSTTTPATTPAVLVNLKKAASRGISRANSGKSANSSAHQATTCPQLAEHELVTRLELYLRYLLRIVAAQQQQRRQQHCVLEPVRALKTRTRCLVGAFVDTVGTVRHVNPVLTKLLVAATKEILAVTVLSEQLATVIRKIVSNYVHTTSFASLAFLSSPETCAHQRLTPVILQYFCFLEKNWEKCVAECDQERMLATTLDGEMRRTFKHSEFQSIGHLLEVCQSFRQELQNIELPPTTAKSKHGKDDDDDEELQQAALDMQREVIAVNGSVLPPVKSRSALIELLSTALNTRTVMESSKSRRRRRTVKKDKRSNDGTANAHATTSSSEEHWVSPLSGNEAELSESSKEADHEVPPLQEAARATKIMTNRPAGGRRRSAFRLSTIDMLTKRLLLAASRTGTGGDAYFVVRDLFGGEDVEVVPSQHQHGVRTIDLIVRLASVTIKCHASFDVYPKSLVGDCEPLIQIHTTSTETIALQEVRANDPQSTAETGSAVMVLQERQTDTSGRRILSVRPALYEKVEVWNTPS